MTFYDLEIADQQTKREKKTESHPLLMKKGNRLHGSLFWKQNTPTVVRP